MIRRRGAQPSHDSSSDEDDDGDDAFSALSKRDKSKREEKSGPGSLQNGPYSSQPKLPVKLPASTTSSMKRHHGAISDSRKSKMDALLQELEAEKESGTFRKQEPSFVPEKKGSFVEPWEEHLTTNIFVGNLAPSITEEALTDVFRQFGDLYSVKIMWPRTPEERSRNRNTGFVCFMNRADAEEAMDACDDADPFNVGRRLMLRWGKNVKKIVKHGTGGAAPIQKKALSVDDFPLPSKRRRTESFDESGTHCRRDRSQSTDKSFKFPAYDPEVHEKDAIHVKAPRDPKRACFITTIASFIAKDGAFLEHKLIEKESGNPDFTFLTMDENSSEQQQDEHIFYRWRVYAFCQGDSVNTWRTRPFVMVYPGGQFWIPPSIDRQAAWQEEEQEREREESIRRQKQHRRRYGGKRELMTGRQIEQRRAAAGASDGGAVLTNKELDQFYVLVRHKICASRKTICEAMAFCFEKSAAAKQIASMLKDVLTETRPGISIDTRISRLYLLSDVLFNSQQPGVRNAFLYRDAIERMAPEVFTSLGQHREGKIGRLTLNKLSNAVSSVLGAWTNWSVYNPTFIDELHARFEGREIPIDVAPEQADESKDDNQEDGEESNDQIVINVPRGDWAEVTDDPDNSQDNRRNNKLDEVKANDDSDAQRRIPSEEKSETQSPAEKIEKQMDENIDVDGEPVDVDGEPVDDDVDGEPVDDDVDGEPVDDDGDGDPVDDIDGEVVDEAEIDDIDGEPVDDIGDSDLVGKAIS